MWAPHPPVIALSPFHVHEIDGKLIPSALVVGATFLWNFNEIGGNLPPFIRCHFSAEI